MPSRTEPSCAGTRVSLYALSEQCRANTPRLVNLAVPTPGVKFKKSPMPFIQMENISHFLRACESAPLSMPSHDRFLTVDLYEAKDPAQVLQCLSAFSRVANSIKPSNFPTTIGPRRGGGPLSPAATGAQPLQPSLQSPAYARSRGPSTTSNTSGSTTFNPLARPQPERALSPHLTGGSNSSKTSNGIPKSPPGGISSWSRRTDEGVTSPAWNIHQYGYMGGASQGNQGIAFGARRQITSAGPHVPNLAEKERKRREKEAEDERLRVQAEEAEHRRRVERQAEEERQWEEETRKQKEAKQRQLEKQKQEWEEQERQWKLEEEMRQREEQEQQERTDQESRRKRAGSDARLRGQYLSQYQAEQSHKPRSRRSSQYEPESNTEQDRIKELERQLEEAKERERQYQLEREERAERRRERARSKSRTRNRSQSRPRPQPPPRAPSPQDSTASWAHADDRDYLRKQWQETQRQPPRPLPEPMAPVSTARPLPEPSPRPLPDPATYAKQNRTDRYLASNPPPVAPKPTSYIPPELTSTSERAGEDARRVESQAKTKAAGWASKSLLEREMERERERQQEWEESQRALQSTPKDPNAGTGEGQSWDVNQYGYMGGDSQNKGGISFGGRRQILGPRPFGQR